MTKKCLKLFSLLVILSPFFSYAQDFWQHTNGPCGGMICSLAVDSSGHLFAGTYGGIFRSIDNGDSWTKVNTGLTNTYILYLAVNSSGDLFAGTSGGGVFRSTDNGNSWTQVNTGLTNSNVRSIAVNSSK